MRLSRHFASGHRRLLAECEQVRCRVVEKVAKVSETSPMIVIIGPAPGQAGGVSSVMSYLKSEVEPRREYDLKFINTVRSDRWSVGRFLTAILKTVWILGRARLMRRRVAVHLNVSVRGSTYRKWVFSLVCRVFATPYVFHLHGGRYAGFLADSSAVVRMITSVLVRGATRVIVLGSIWRDFVVSELDVPESKVAVIVNGTPRIVPAAAVRTGSNSKVRVIFSGRLDAKKGVADLIQAADSLYEEFAEFELVFMGDSRDSSLLAEVESRPYSIVTGWLAHDQVVEQLALCDIFVLPSHDEGFPMAMVEAMSLGLPVIVTSVGAIPDAVVDGREGYLIEARDVQGLTRSLRSLVLDGSLRQEMGRSAYSRWKTQLDSELMARNIESQWDAALISNSSK